MSPERIRATIREAAEQFLNADVQFGALQFDFFGRTVVDNVELWDAQQPSKKPVLKVKRVVLLHDWKRLLRGKFLLTGIQATAPEVLLAWGRDGQFNWADLIKPSESSGAPFDDGALAHGLSVTDAKLTFAFDDKALSVAGIEASGAPENAFGARLAFRGRIADPAWGAYEVSGLFDTSLAALDLRLLTRSLRLTREVVERIPQIGPDLWRYVQPTGEVRAEARITVDPRRQPPCAYDVRVECADLRAAYLSFPVPVWNLTGTVDVRDGLIAFPDLVGTVGSAALPAAVSVGGTVDLNKRYARVHFKGDDLEITDELVSALPADAAAALRDSKVGGRVAITGMVRTEWGGDPWERAYRIQVGCDRCKLLFRPLGLETSDIQGQVTVASDGLSCPRLTGRGAGGTWTLQCTATLRDAEIAHQGAVEFANVRIQELAGGGQSARHRLAGLLSGKLDFVGVAGEAGKFDADGHATLTEGDVFTLPVLVGMLNVFNLNMPKRESFHTGKAEFSLSEDSIYLKSATISSEVLDVHGSGRVAYDGAVDLTLLVELDPDFFRIPLVSKVMTLTIGKATKKLGKARVTGTFWDPKVESEAFEGILKPVKHIYEMLPKVIPKSRPETKQDAQTAPSGRKGFVETLLRFRPKRKPKDAN